MSDPVITVEDVWKRFRLYKERPQNLKETLLRRRGPRYEEFWALRSVSLEVDAGTTYGIIGHNGSGKSTFLRLIAGIHRATKGRVTATGRIAALLELGAGFHPDLTGRENVYLNGSILGLTRREITRAFDTIVDFSGLERFIDTPVKLYSSGMFMRLGFSIAVHLDPQILLIDEIIAVGDEEFQRRSLDHLYQLRRSGVTIVLVSHALGTIQTLCERSAWLDHGLLLAEGPTGEVIDAYMGHVNVSEQERRAAEQEKHAAPATDAPASEPAPLEPHRYGSREAEITAVEFLDASGQMVSVATFGEPLTIRIRYRSHVPITEPIFGWEIYHASGMLMAGTNTRASHVETGIIEGDGHVDYHMPRLLAMADSYRVTTAIADEHGMHVFDRHEKTDVLRVQPKGNPERYGMYELPGRWELGTRAPSESRR